MDVSSRKEPFRYVMNQPLECWIEVPISSSGPGAGKLTEAVLLDLSRSGCKCAPPESSIHGGRYKASDSSSIKRRKASTRGQRPLGLDVRTRPIPIWS